VAQHRLAVTDHGRFLPSHISIFADPSDLATEMDDGALEQGTAPVGKRPARQLDDE
jgi:hypothetical protein